MLTNRIVLVVLDLPCAQPDTTTAMRLLLMKPRSKPHFIANLIRSSMSSSQFGSTASVNRSGWIPRCK